MSELILNLDIGQISGKVEKVKSMFSELDSSVKNTSDVFKNIWSKNNLGNFDNLCESLNKVQDATSKTFDSFKTLWKGVGLDSSKLSGIEELGTKIGSVTNQALEMGSKFKGVFSGLSKSFGTIKGSFKDLGGSLKNVGSSLKNFQGLGSAFKGFGTSIKGVGSALKGLPIMGTVDLAVQAGNAIAGLANEFSAKMDRQMAEIQQNAKVEGHMIKEVQRLRTIVSEEEWQQILKLKNAEMVRLEGKVSGDKRIVQSHQLVYDKFKHLLTAYDEEQAKEQKRKALYDAASQSIKKYMDKYKVSFEEAQKAVKQHIELDKKRKAAYESMASKLGILTKSKLKDFKEQEKALLELYKDQKVHLKDNKDLAVKFYEKSSKLAKTYKDSNVEVNKELNNMNEELEELTEPKEIILSLPTLPSIDFSKWAPNFSEIGFSTEAFKEYKTSIDDTTQKTDDLADSNDNTVDSYYKLHMKIDEASMAVMDATGAIAALGIISEGTAQKVGQVVDGLTDAAHGAATFAKGLASKNPFEMISGAAGVITGLAKAIAVFKTDGVKDAVKDLTRPFKDDMDPQLFKTWRSNVMQYAKSLDGAGQSHRAFNHYLYELIDNADITTDTFESYAKTVGEIACTFDDGSQSLKETVESMDSAFDSLAKKQEELGGHYSHEMKKIIVGMADRGIDVPAIKEYIEKRQAEGLEGYKSMIKTLDLDGANKSIEELEQKLRGLRDGSKEFLAAQQELETAKTKYKDMQAAVDVFGGIHISMFDEMIAKEERLAKNSELIEKYKGYETAMASFFDTASMSDITEDKMNEYGSVLQNVFTKMKDGGMTSVDALEQMAPSLSRIIELSKAHGFQIDANTQAMINEAREAGVTLTPQYTVQEKMVKCMETLVEVMGGELPYAAEQAGEALGNAFKSSDEAVKKAEDDTKIKGEEIKDSGKKAEEGINKATEETHGQLIPLFEEVNGGLIKLGEVSDTSFGKLKEGAFTTGTSLQADVIAKFKEAGFDINNMDEKSRAMFEKMMEDAVAMENKLASEDENSGFKKFKAVALAEMSEVDNNILALNTSLTNMVSTERPIKIGWNVDRIDLNNYVTMPSGGRGKKGSAPGNYANGTFGWVTTPSHFIVGEGGEPELLETSGGRTRITPLSRIPRINADGSHYRGSTSGDGNTNTYNISVNGTASSQDKTEFAEIMKSIIRDNFRGTATEIRTKVG